LDLVEHRHPAAAQEAERVLVEQRAWLSGYKSWSSGPFSLIIKCLKSSHSNHTTLQERLTNWE
jgi:hypothetical protein